jgi:hypothetical protein
LRWQKDGDDHVLVSSVPVLGRRGPRIGPEGIASGLLWRKTWPWAGIAAVSWDVIDGAGTLALCLHRDAWPKELSTWAWPWDITWEKCRALLEEIRPVVERMGARVENREEAAVHWWHLDPEARRF